MIPPRKLTVSGPQAEQWGRSVDFARQAQPGLPAGSGMIQTPHGTVYRTQRQRRQVAQQSESFIQIMAVVGLTGADTMVCRTWDGTNLGADEITVAKQHRLWPSIATDGVDGVTLTYTYPVGSDPNNVAQMKDNYRTASDGANTESQIVYPRYQALDPDLLDDVAGDPTLITPGLIITACKPQGGTLVADVEWLEILPARVWARCYIQPTP